MDDEMRGLYARIGLLETVAEDLARAVERALLEGAAVARQQMEVALAGYRVAKPNHRAEPSRRGALT